MRNSKPKTTITRSALPLSAEARARHQAIRELFRDWHPSPEELISSGEGAKFDIRCGFRDLGIFVEAMKQARNAAGLTLAEVSQRCGIDEPALSRLENGHNQNPTLDTLWRYAAAVGRRLILKTEPIQDTRQRRKPAKQAAAARKK